MKTKLFLLMAAVLFACSTAKAYDAEIDGIYYNFNGDEAEVTYKDLRKNSYSGDIIIPESVIYNYTTYSVTSIGNGAFTSSGLTSITIPNSITSIKTGVFANCTDLSSINVEAGNTIYDSRNNCNAIIETATNALIAGCKNTIIPNSVMSIGVAAFDRCSGLTTISIPNSIISIEDYAFQGCTGLTSISIPNSVSSIGMGAFYYCTKITTIFISNSVASIKDAAFCDCASLTDVYCLAENMPNTSNYAFDATPLNYATLHVPYGCKAAYEAASPWNEFETIVEMEPESPIISFADAKVKALCVANWDTNSDGELDEAEAAAVTDLGTVFRNKNITSFNELQYFTGLTSIGHWAFRDCSGLTSVSIPNSVTSIDSQAFSFCSGLTSIKVESSNTTYDSRNDCNAIIETVTNTLIQGCKTTTIPNSVTNIGSSAFSGCSGLTSVTIPNSVTNIGHQAFSGCSGLTSVSIPNSVTRIDSQAFSFCSGLTSVTIPNSVTRMGVDVFSDCSGLTSVNIPNSVTRIEDGTFSRCSGLTSVTIPNSVTSIGIYAFSGCSGLTSVTIPNSVTSIEGSAFSGCSGLTSVSIPNSVTRIGGQAFSGCSGLTSVIIENSVKLIEFEAFRNCYKLADVYCYAKNVPSTVTGNTTFKNSNTQNATLHVPYGCKAAYEAASPWNGFGEIVEMTSPITIGETGFATFCSPYALDYSEVTDIRAYIVSGFNQENGTLVLTRVTEVPAGEGLYIAGIPGEHQIPQTQTSMFYANLLKGVAEPTIISPTDGNYTNYILSNGSYGVGFYTLSTTGTLDGGKAYLQLPTASVAGVKALKIEFDENDDPTGIAITSASATEENTIYNLAGQRVSQPQKGINIINGKKVFIK